MEDAVNGEGTDVHQRSTYLTPIHPKQVYEFLKILRKRMGTALAHVAPSLLPWPVASVEDEEDADRQLGPVREPEKERSQLRISPNVAVALRICGIGVLLLGKPLGSSDMVKPEGGVDANATKDHLYEIAQRLEIEGRSEMTKDELVEAIQKANDRQTAAARDGD